MFEEIKTNKFSINVTIVTNQNSFLSMIPLMSSAKAQGHPGIVRSCAIANSNGWKMKRLTLSRSNVLELLVAESPSFAFSARRQKNNTDNQLRRLVTRILSIIWLCKHPRKTSQRLTTGLSLTRSNPESTTLSEWAEKYHSLVVAYVDPPMALVPFCTGACLHRSQVEPRAGIEPLAEQGNDSKGEDAYGSHVNMVWLLNAFNLLCYLEAEWIFSLTPVSWTLSTWLVMKDYFRSDLVNHWFSRETRTEAGFYTVQLTKRVEVSEDDYGKYHYNTRGRLHTEDDHGDDKQQVITAWRV